MKREKTLLKNTFILSLGKMFPQFTGLITLPIYTGMLTNAEYGRYDLINVIVYILSIAIVLQIHQAVFRFLIEVRGTKDEAVYITNTFAFEIPLTIVASVIFGIAFSSLDLITRMLLGLYLFFTMQNTVTGQIARGQGYNRHYAVAAIINPALNMAMVIILMSGVKLGFKGLFISLDLAYFSSALYLFIFCAQYKKISFSTFDFRVIKKMLKYSWPMVPNTLSIWIVNSCDKFIIRYALGLEMNGIFAVAQKIPNIFSIAYSTFNMAWQESASISVRDSDANRYYTSIFSALFDFLTGSMLVLISLTPMLFSFLVKGDYDLAYDQMSLLYIGVFLSSISSFFGSIYIAKMATKEVGISSMLGAVVNCIINIVLIKKIGLYAASISTVVSYLILAVYRGIDINMKGYASIYYNKKHILACIVMIGISSFICYQRMFLLNIINFVFGSIAFAILNRKMIKAILLAIRERLNE